MTSKINISRVIARHLDTFKDDELKFRYKDILLFFGIPAVPAIISCTNSYEFSNTVLTNLLTIEALLSGLLLNLLVLVYSLKERTPKVDVSVEGWERLQLKHRIVDEVYFNVAFSTLTAFLMLIFTAAHSFLEGVNFGAFYPNSDLIDPIVIFIGLNLIFNFLMIIKRISVLYCNEDH